MTGTRSADNPATRAPAQPDTIHVPDLDPFDSVPAGDLEPYLGIAEYLPADRFSNRELSWLAFNARVLALGEDQRQPLLERMKFLAIFASNLDEFYMVRIAGLKRRVEMGLQGL
ncbi:MAG TPA: hypothetical protein VEK09_07260, partial [Jatrophihabitantaceae bacterium]|nr:hypothetical protein [Jatrophihabitantaceae bacterium]